MKFLKIYWIIMVSTFLFFQKLNKYLKIMDK